MLEQNNSIKFIINFIDLNLIIKYCYKHNNDITCDNCHFLIKKRPKARYRFSSLKMMHCFISYVLGMVVGGKYG